MSQWGGGVVGSIGEVSVGWLESARRDKSFALSGFLIGALLANSRISALTHSDINSTVLI